MEDRGNKTIMCSVFFLDIVGYSKKSVSGQISLKDRFNSYLSEAIRDVPVTDRIILDTGDGAAINFLGDVEDALKAALSLRESLLNEDPDSDNPLLIRMGVNLGPVRLVKDINGQPNIVGDGINVAQRVMGFADAGQVLVSRSYYDAVSRLSPQYAEMFHYQGSRTDKHVREHEVYAIGYPGELTSKFVQDDKADGTLARMWGSARQSWDATAARLDGALALLLEHFAQAEPKRRAIYVAAGVLSLLLVAALGVMLAGGQNGGDQDMQPGAAVLPVSSVLATVPSVAEGVPAPARAEPDEKADQKPAAESKANGQKVAPQKTAQTKPATQPKPTQSKSSQSKPPETATKKGFFDSASSGEVGFLSVSCKEGAQVFVNGTQKGATGTGPLSLTVPAGKLTVIVTHASGGIATQSVEVGAGKTVRIKPAFCGQ